MSTTPESINTEIAALQSEESRLWEEVKRADDVLRAKRDVWNVARQKLNAATIRSETVAELRKEILAELLAQKEADDAKPS